MGREMYIKKVSQFAQKLSKDFEVDMIIFFGSRARGNYKEYSDIDLIIVSDGFEGMNLFERVARMYDYWEFDLPVDFLCYTKKEFEDLKKRISIVSAALKEGMKIKV